MSLAYTTISNVIKYKVLNESLKPIIEIAFAHNIFIGGIQARKLNKDWSNFLELDKKEAFFGLFPNAACIVR